MAWGVNGLILAICAESVLEGEAAMCDGKGQEEGSKSPSLSNLSLERVKLWRGAEDDIMLRGTMKEEESLHAWVGEESMSIISREHVGEDEE